MRYVSSRRAAVVTAIASIAVIGIATPSANAQAIPAIPVPATPCTYIQVPIGPADGNPGTSPIQVCQGAGLSFVGPMIGQLGSVVGPVTIGPAVVGSAGAAMGNIGAGS